MAKKKLTKKLYLGLLKMNIEQLKAYIIENDSRFIKHIPACDYESYFNGMFQDALLAHALYLSQCAKSDQ